MTSTPLQEPARRHFLKKSSALLASGLAIGFHWSGATAKSPADTTAEDEFEPNAWVRVLPDNTVKIVVAKHDSGTGTHTALAACVAEELDVDPFIIDVITPENPFYIAYIHPRWKVFSTGGSTSVMLEYDRLRKAGATARAMLVQAAAQKWKVKPESCSTANREVVHTKSGLRATYGELADAAGQLAAPKDVPLKSPEDFKYIGKLKHKRDTLAKVTGAFTYSIDMKLPDMLVAVITRSPVIGARVKNVDAGQTLKMPGVRKVIVVPGRPDILGGNQEGVAVLATDFWSAEQARKALKITWTDSELATFDSDKIADIQKAWLHDSKAPVVHTIVKGDVDTQWKVQGSTVVNAAYRMPYKAANPMEPICVTAWVYDGGVTFYGGVQVPSSALEAAEVICKVSKDKVVINDTISGGSFGAREAKYWLFEAVYLSREAGVPVKLMNSREDEMRSLYGHAASYHEMKAALNAKGELTALHLRAVAPASPEQWEPGYFDRADHMDYSTTEAISKWDFAYSAANMDVGWVRHETGVPTGWYRAVSFIPNVFSTESFIDEVAHTAQKDALAFRVAHMKDRPRHVHVLRTACERAGWGKKLPDSCALGMATNQGYNSYIAVVAEVAKKDSQIIIRKLTCVVDCGLAVSPSGVREQIYGGLMWGLGHATKDKLDIKNGRVQQHNFYDYLVMRMMEMPEIDITIIDGNPAKPSGVGELSNPCVTPAIANAIFNLTGKRQRATPLNFQLAA